MTMVLPDGSELVYDGQDIVPVGDRGLPRTVLHRRRADSRGPAHEITIEVCDGIPTIAAVKLTAENGAHIRGKDIKLSGAGLDRLVTDWLAKVTYQPGDTAGHPDYDWVQRYPVKVAERAAATRAAARRPTRRRRVTAELLRKVAETYKNADPPKHEAIAIAFEVEPRTAQRYIEKAREARLLPPSDRTRK